MKNRKQESGVRSQKSAWIGLLLALVCAGAVYAGVGVGGGSQIITVDSATQAGIDATVSATNNATLAVVAGKVTTNAVLDKLQLLDGSSLTNVTANTDLSRAGTNALGGISFVMLDGTNLLAVVGTTTNQVYLAPYSP
jgi:hypothetical protein